MITSFGKSIDDSVHVAFGPVLVLSQIFGIMPVQGVLGPTADNLRFRWRSLRVVYAGLMILTSAMSVMISLTAFVKGLEKDFLSTSKC